jgi:two-component system NarL family sensor kinase
VSDAGTGELRRRNEELAILNTVAQALNGEVDLARALATTLRHVAELLGLETGWVWLLDEATGEPYLAAAHDLPPALANYPHRMEGDCYCLDTFRAGDLAGAANINVVTCSRLKWLKGGTRGLRYHASVPLYAHGAEVGVLNVASTDWRELSAEDLRLLHTIGDMLGIAVERARLFDQSVRLGAAEERNRLAREIHDTLAQDLSGIALQLETADALLEGGADRERARDAVRRALDLARDGLRDARRSVLDLRAAPLEGRTLAEALADLVRAVEEHTGAEVTFDVVGASRPLPPRIEAGAYRIAREALVNVARHAEATIVEVSLAATPEELRLVVADDGRGFDPGGLPSGRFGLQGMSERARLLGGRLKLSSGVGEGTRVEAVLPLDDGSDSPEAA